MAWVTRDVTNLGYNFVFDAIGSGNLAAAGGAEIGHVQSLAGPVVSIVGDILTIGSVAGADNFIVYAFATGDSIVTPGVPDNRNINIFNPTNNTYFARSHAVRYAVIPATQTTFNLRTGFAPALPDGNYIIRVQSISNNTVGGVAPLPRFNSLLSPATLEYTLARIPLPTPVVATASTWRTFTVTGVAGATGYNIYAFASLADAQSGDPSLAVAVSRNQIANTTPADHTGAPTPGANQLVFDVRLLQFENVGTNDSIRTLPAGYIPADIGVSQTPGVFGVGNQSNLRPGMYWFRVSAVDSTGVLGESPMAAMDPNTLQGFTPNLFSIAVGPSEGRAKIEALVAGGGVPGTDFHVLDIRTLPNPGLESANEGLIRFTNHSQGFSMANYVTNVGAPLNGAPLDVPIFLY